MHTNALSLKRLIVVIGAIVGLAAEGIVFGFAPEMSPIWTILGSAAFLQIVVMTAAVISLAKVAMNNRRRIRLSDACFGRLERALVVLFEATVAGHDKETRAGRDAYLTWRARYIDDFGVPTIIDHACRGTLPGNPGLVIHAEGLAKIREFTRAAVAAAGIRAVAA